jgi:hypothetical protein
MGVVVVGMVAVVAAVVVVVFLWKRICSGL